MAGAAGGPRWQEEAAGPAVTPQAVTPPVTAVMAISDKTVPVEAPREIVANETPNRMVVSEVLKKVAVVGAVSESTVVEWDQRQAAAGGTLHSRVEVETLHHSLGDEAALDETAGSGSPKPTVVAAAAPLHALLVLAAAALRVTRVTEHLHPTNAAAPLREVLVAAVFLGKEAVAGCLYKAAEVASADEGEAAG